MNNAIWQKGCIYYSILRTSTCRCMHCWLLSQNILKADWNVVSIKFKSRRNSSSCFSSLQDDPLQTVELLHNKKIFSNGQKKSPLLHIDQNMTPFIILEKNFFVPFKKVEFLFAFVAKQSFVEQNGAHFWHISSKTSWLAEIGLHLSQTHKIRNPDDPENFGFFPIIQIPDFMGYK